MIDASDFTWPVEMSNLWIWFNLPMKVHVIIRWQVMLIENFDLLCLLSIFSKSWFWSMLGNSIKNQGFGIILKSKRGGGGVVVLAYCFVLVAPITFELGGLKLWFPKQSLRNGEKWKGVSSKFNLIQDGMCVSKEGKFVGTFSWEMA